MNGIPLPLIRANQYVMVALSLLAILFTSKLLATLLFIMTITPLVLGPNWNVVFRVAKPLLADRLKKNTQFEAMELQRFNQSIATVLLGLGIVWLWLYNHWFGYVLIGFVTLAAAIALCGFCVGCFLYFQLKKLQHRLR